MDYLQSTVTTPQILAHFRHDKRVKSTCHSYLLWTGSNSEGGQLLLNHEKVIQTYIRGATNEYFNATLDWHPSAAGIALLSIKLQLHPLYLNTSFWWQNQRLSGLLCKEIYMRIYHLKTFPSRHLNSGFLTNSFTPLALKSILSHHSSISASRNFCIHIIPGDTRALLNQPMMHPMLQT